MSLDSREDLADAGRVTSRARGHADPSSAEVPEQSRAQRATSFDIADFPVPTGREEEWRFTPVDRLRGALSEVPEASEGAGPTLSVQVSAPQYVGDSLAPGQAPRGAVLVPADRAAALASAGTPHALHLQIPADTDVTEAVRIAVHGNGGLRADAHQVIEIGSHARATVVIEHTGSAVLDGNVEVLVGDGADLTVVSVQRWEDDAIHLGQHDAVVGSNATYKHVAVSLGGRVVRLNSNVRFGGPGADATLLGVYFADTHQHLEHRSFVDHDQPHCASHVTYKGALQGDSAHTVWVGDVLIRAGADGTNTYELNRNLLLTEGARADSVPNLEIETGEITGAGHASSTGRFDDEQLFYLTSRGIPQDIARRLVVRGFFADIVAKIGVPDVVDSLMAAIDDELSVSMGDPAGAALVEVSA